MMAPRISSNSRLEVNARATSWNTRRWSICRLSITSNDRLSFNRFPYYGNISDTKALSNSKKEFQKVAKTTRTLTTDVHHIPRWLFKTRFPDVMTRLFVHHDLPYVRCQLRISSTPHHLAVQIMVALRKQTRPYLSIRG